MFASRPGNGGFAKAMRIIGEVLSILVGFHSEKEEDYTELYCSKQTEVFV